MKSTAAFFCCLAVSLSLSARTLHWKSLDVQAKVEKSGELRIREHHVMVFDGDWNGGERTFRVEPGQELTLVSLSRVDSRSGAEVPLKPGGSPPDLHEYAWADAKTLRWRVRRPSDPPLRNAELGYVLVYTLRNVIARDGEQYRLDHDFAFENRTGPIERYTLQIELDPAWQAAADAPLQIERTSIPPGQTVVVNIPMRYLAEGAPQFIASAAPMPAQPLPAADAAPPPPPPAWLLPAKGVVFALFLLASWIAVRMFQARERSAGRYDAAPEVDRRWLESNLFTHRPEVVGTAWDNTTGEAEVAALIAVMTLEGKLERGGSVASPQLRLLVPRESLSEYERAFVDRMFVQGDTIDPQTLRKHYKSTGFDPARTLREPLAHAARNLAGAPPSAFAILAGCLAFVIVPFVITTVSVAAGEPPNLMFGSGVVLIASLLIGGSYYRNLKGPESARLIALPPVLFALLGLVQTGVVMTVVVPAIALALLIIALAFSRWRGTPEQLRNRRNLLAARRYFMQMLERADAMVEDRWIPYLLAFGLSKELDRWSVSAPAAAQRMTPLTTRSSSASGPSSPRFAGGGGAFGGGGATGGWGSIASFAASVPSPSSGGSSGSRSSGGGGSRSGGGGGGGW